ncbi:hypothetical protein VTG60DRAFT_3108 [Thermothelomyces hinnuleus]
MATVCQDLYIPLAAASPKSPSRNLLIPESPSSPVSRTLSRSPPPPSPYNVGGTQRSDTKTPQNDVVEISSEDESDLLSDDESDNNDFASLWVRNWNRLNSKSGAGTGNNVATTHATSGGSRTQEPLRADPLHCGDVGGTKVLPKDIIVISSDDESNDEQQRCGPGCSSAPRSISPKALHTKLPQSAVAGSAACQPGQASAPNSTTRSTTAPETDAASLAKHKATRYDRGCQRDPRLSAEPCGTTSNYDGSICLPNVEGDERYPSSREAMPGASILRLSEDGSNNDHELAIAEPSGQPCVQPSANQDRVKFQHDMGRRPRCGTDVKEDHSPVEDGVTEHGRENVIQLPRKRRRISTPTLATCEMAPKRQAYRHRASSRSPRAQRSTTQHATPRRNQRRIPKPRSSGLAPTTEEVQEEYFEVEDILDWRLVYLVNWKGYGHKHDSWEPAEHFDKCPELLRQFHQRAGSAITQLSRKQESAGDSGPREDRPVRSPAA